MTAEQVRDEVIAALRTVAPEADAASLRPDTALRDQLDIDSMDMLRFVIEVNRRLGIDIPERDYGRLATLDGAAQYVGARLGVP